jgi:universal stress protein A
MALYKHILLAVDFTPATDLVAQQAMALCKIFDARLSLVNVVEFVQMDLTNDLVLPQELEIDRELMELARKRLHELAKKLGVDESECFVAQGSTRREILHLAEEQSIDLIVIGSHGREGIQRLLGSTANAVLHGAPCDVLAVRIKDDQRGR